MAFTLIELLVVVAIIGILAALLMPALVGARQRAQGILCLGNVKQLATAWHLYAVDAADLLSPAESIPWDPQAPRWVDGYIEFGLGNVREMTNRTLLLRPGPGRLGIYLQKAEVYRCPGDDSRTNIFQRRGPYRVRSYEMNCYIGFGEGLGVGPGGVTYSPSAFHRLSDFRAKGPADIFTFIDTHELTLAGSQFRIQGAWAPPEGWNGGSHWGASRHGRSCAVAFADGHSELHRWQDARTPRTYPNVAAQESHRSQPQRNNADYAWLWERAWDPERR